MNGEYGSATNVDTLDTPERLRNFPDVAILDCGGQYTQLVGKACERLGYRAVFLPHDTPAEELTEYGALIIAGSPGNAQEEAAPMPDEGIWQLGKPMLGICFGMHAIATHYGGKVEKGAQREDGRVITRVKTEHPFFQSTKPAASALFTHGNFVTEVPGRFSVIGKHKMRTMDADGVSIEREVISAIALGRVIGVQFHPEVFDDTPDGYGMFKAFLSDIAELEPNQEFLERQTSELVQNLRADIAEKVGDRDVIAFLSGGVDSAVAFALTAEVVKSGRLHGYYFDTGFMRDEDDAVISLLKHLDAPITVVDASEYFENANIVLPDDSLSPKLIDMADPELKRQIIGKAFIDLHAMIASERGLENAVLLQGTNAADRVESGHGKGKSTAVIKTHHNQVKEAKALEAEGLLCEPLTNLFKDEIRNVGRTLGLPPEIVERQPFPGPGTAIRILCTGGAEFAGHTRQTSEMIDRWMDKHAKLYGWEKTARLLPVRNVGVGGDERSHLSVLAIGTEAPWQIIRELSSEATDRFKDHINRVVVHLAGSLDARPTITPTSLSKAARRQLRAADRIVFEEMRRFDVIKDISQCPVILLPVSFDGEGKRSIVLRPIKTLTFMTGQAMLPQLDLPAEFVYRCADRIMAEVPDVSTVFLDCTNKPPGTTEWE